MWQPIVGPEAVRGGALTRGSLRWNYTAVHPRIYLANDTKRTLLTNTVAAWLWTQRTGIIAGRAAAALHGAQWVDDNSPVEVITHHGRQRPGVLVREERIDADEITMIGDLPVTTPARTALDLARRLPRDAAVAHMDALAAATGVTSAEVMTLVARYRGSRGLRQARASVSLMDAGSQSPRETRLRLLLIDAGLPRPRTQIRVSDGYLVAFIDMGWDEPKVGLDYDGDHHRSDRRQFVRDIGRYEMIERQDWIDLRVIAEHSPRLTVQRVRQAFARRGWNPPPSST
jgi:AbiEi antitoxin C-terminal domain